MLNLSNSPQTDHFNNLSSQWWNESGAFKSLHSMNPLRIKFIKEIIENYHEKKSLNNLNLLDIGCGGGILCEPLSRLKANVTGIDSSTEAINCAKNHALLNNLNINYLNTTLDNFKGNFDVITCLEMLEHVENVEIICEQILKHLNKNGILIVSTINKTFLSYLVAIIGAEYLSGLVPIGTHEWKKFLKPSEIINIFEKLNCQVLKTKGISYSLLNNNWEISNKININYIMAIKKLI